MSKLELSNWPKTWLIDVDGTIFIHNSHLDKGDVLIDGVKEFFDSIPESDMIILLTARKEMYREATLSSLKKFDLRYDQIFFELPRGERVLINDEKPQLLKEGVFKTAIAITLVRDRFNIPEITFDPDSPPA